MSSSVERKLKGYAEVKISGVGTERFLTIAAKKNIDVWNISCCGKDIEFFINIGSLKKINEILEKTGCKAEIKGKYGLWQYILMRRLKLFFILGIVFFAVSMNILGAFVWDISVEGTERTDKSEIIRLCSENMLKTGVLKSSVDLRNIENILKDNFDDIAWVRISFSGTCAEIKIAENIPKLEERNNEPCDIIASKDGIIMSITAAEGTPLVKEGDVVKKGDVLISASVTVTENESIVSEKEMHAEGMVIGKFWAEEQENVPFIYYTKEFTGRKTSNYIFDIFNKEFKADFINKTPDYEKYDTLESENRIYAGKNFALPLLIKKTEYREYTVKKNKYNENEAVQKAEMSVKSKIYDTFGEDKVKDIKVYLTKNNEGVTASALATIVDEIGKTEYR